MINTKTDKKRLAMNKTLILKITALCLVCSFVTGLVVYAGSPSIIQTIGLGPYPGAPAYTIYRVGSTYYARDQNGVNEYSDTNASYVIQSTIDAAAEGSLIHLDAATYSLTNTGTDEPITIDKQLVFEGEGEGTVLEYDGTFRWAMIHVRGDTVGAVVRDLKIDGNQNNATSLYPNGVWVGVTDGSENTDNTIIENVVIVNTGVTGINIDLSCDNTKILNNYLENIGNAVTIDPMIRVSQESDGTIINGNTFIMVGAEEAGVRTYLDVMGGNYSEGTIISDNFFTGLNVGSAVSLNGRNEVVSGNTFFETGYSSGQAVYLQKAINTAVTGNSFFNITGHGVTLENATAATITGNSIYWVGAAGGVKHTIYIVQGTENVTITGNTLYGAEGINACGVYIQGNAGFGNSTNIIVNGNVITNTYFGTWEVTLTDYNCIIGNIITVLAPGNEIRRAAGVGSNSLGDNTINLVY